MNRPWIIGEDFNVLLKPEDCSKYDGNQACCSVMRSFGDCLNDIGVEDHPYIGPTFTWTTNQVSNFQVRKLDRILVNDEWNVEYPCSMVEFKPPGVLDH